MAVTHRAIVDALKNATMYAELSNSNIDESELYELLTQLNAIRAMCNERLYEMVFEEAYE